MPVANVYLFILTGPIFGEFLHFRALYFSRHFAVTIISCAYCSYDSFYGFLDSREIVHGILKYMLRSRQERE